MNLYLHSDLKSYFTGSISLFDQIMALQGECFRSQEGRLTLRVRIGEKFYFLKQHTGIGWKEIFKNLFQGRLPVTSAKNEYLAIKKLKSLHVAVPAIVGYGKRGLNPARQQSFILMEELTPTMSLEELGRTWCTMPPTFSFKLKLIREVARITRLMHISGMNHRDLYLCHFLLQRDDHFLLHLIDLHRAQIRSKAPARWRIKDLAGLYFSSKDLSLTQRDILRFIREYSHQPIKSILQNEHRYWQKVKNRGDQLYRDHSRK